MVVGPDPARFVRLLHLPSGGAAARMGGLNGSIARAWTRLGPGLLPFADAARAERPMGRLLRLSLFQVSVGMCAVLLIGTLNRVMIVELGVPAGLVATMVSLPLVFAPPRAPGGVRSGTRRSALGWRGVPFPLIGHILHFCGPSIMSLALPLSPGAP